MPVTNPLNPFAQLMKVGPNDFAVSVSTGSISVTGLGFGAASATNYAFLYHLSLTTQASTTGWKLGMNGPAGAVYEYMINYQIGANAAAGTSLVPTFVQRKDVASMAMAFVTPNNFTSLQEFLVQIEGTIRVSATAGTIDVLALTAVAASNVTIKKGSWGFRF